MIDLYPIIKPFIFTLDPEKAHEMTLKALSAGLSPVCFSPDDDPILACNIFGLDMPNPIGLAAGFDKNADVMGPMLKAGFGFVEAGTVTPEPQAGNDKPRLFRLKEDKAVINRYGFNNAGLAAFKGRLEKRKAQPGIIGANIGANKNSADRTADYITCFDALYGLSNYFTINISSPNTPGLRALQSYDALSDLLGKIIDRRKEKLKSGDAYIPILLKIAPDLLDADKQDIVRAVTVHGIDGLIIANTTITRPEGLISCHRTEAGGLSGAPLMDISTEILKEFYQLTKGKLPLIGVGGIASGDDAYRKIRAGASLVQLYSALVFEGPGLIPRIKRQLTLALKADGYGSIKDAIGADVTL